MDTITFAQSALDTLAAAASFSPSPPRLVFLPDLDGSDFQDRLEDLAREINNGTGGAIDLTTGDEGDPPDSPALSVLGGRRAVAHYLALPEGSEAQPFLDLLIDLTQDASGKVARLAGEIDHPCDLMVFVTPGCPNCPHAVKTAAMLAAASGKVTLTVVDATRFTETAERFKVQSVPTTVIDGQMTLIGVVPMKKLATHIADRGDSDHAEEVFASLVAAGRFDEAAAHLGAGTANHAFRTLWARSSLETRLGLAMAAETALEADSRGLDGLAATLLTLLDSDNPAIRGDTADLLGKIGSPSSREALTALLNDPDEDVREAAEDALDAIRE